MSVAYRIESCQGGCRIGGPPWQKRLKSLPAAGVWNFLGFRLDCGPAADPFFRRAVAAGLHSPSLAGALAPAGGVFHPELYPQEPSTWCGADRSLSSQLLRQAGYSGTRVRAVYTMTNAIRRSIATAALRQLQEIGLQVELQGVPVDELERRVRAGEAEMFIAGMIMPADPAEAAHMFCHGGSANLFGLADPRIERHFARLQNGRASWPDLAGIEQTLKSEAVLVPISFSTWEKRPWSPVRETWGQWAV